MSRRLCAWTLPTAAVLIMAAAPNARLLAAPAQSPPSATSSRAPVCLLHAKPRQPQLPKAARQHLKDKFRKNWQHLPPGQRKKLLALFQQAVAPNLQKAIADHQAAALAAPAGNALMPIQPDQPPPDGGSLSVYASAYPASGPAPLGVSFSAGVYDPYAINYDFFWDFGDGATDFSQSPVHTYTTPGTYLTTIYASDDAGGSASDSVLITVTGSGGNLPPQVSISASPASGRAPLTVNFSANASDPDGYITDISWSFGDGSGASGQSLSHTYAAGSYVASVTVTDNAGASATASAAIAVSSVSSSGPDGDGDGLPDDFERQLADNFTPAYFLSLFELPGTGLSLFQDRPDAEVVTQIFPTSFPQTATSYYRVTPLGVVNGQSYLQIDYATLWSRDDGLALSAACGTDIDILSIFGIMPSLGTGLTGHDLDNERSAIRVVAPAVGGGFNTDVNAYRVDRIFTAAHEDTLFDHSEVVAVDPPLGPEVHFGMFPSLSKHGTYLFWPHGLPLMPDWMIASIYGGIDASCFIFDLDPDTCDLLFFIADEVVFDCITEKHVPQGGVLARPDLRINVGELGQPLPGGSFIQSGELHMHLLKRFVIP
ncbi:MAG TPA: PKD domain-containing protein [Thermoanaerobaculia bacterium]|nr:PKD domain-containing protein [Thermoanaerobaculia bacterium]